MTFLIFRKQKRLIVETDLVILLFFCSLYIGVSSKNFFRWKFSVLSINDNINGDVLCIELRTIFKAFDCLSVSRTSYLYNFPLQCKIQLFLLSRNVAIELFNWRTFSAFQTYVNDVDTFTLIFRKFSSNEKNCDISKSFMYF